MSPVRRTWVVENTWVCTSCQRKNLGRHVKCESCGNPKDRGERDTVPEPGKAPEVTDPELLRLARQGPNWVCEYCGGQVRDEHGKCAKNCGAPRPSVEPPEPPTAPEPSRSPPRASASPQSPPRPQPRPPPTSIPGPGRRPYRPEPSRLRFRIAVTLGVGAGVAGLVALGVFLFMPWEVTAKVSALRWDYRADLRQRVTLHGSGWGSPGGAFNVSCKRKWYGTENCNPHNCNPHSVSYECNCTSYECNCSTHCSDNGNGFSTCSETCSTCQQCSTCSRIEYDTCYDQCDVYKDWCEYDYYDWPIIKTLTTSGSSHNEHWPDLAADGPLQRLDKTERYSVDFVKEAEVWIYKPRQLAEFQRYVVGKPWRIKVNRVRSVTPLEPLTESGERK